MATERDRASFEHWHIQRQRSRGYGAFLSDAEFVTRDESGRYRTLGLDDALEAWCAALASAPAIEPVSPMAKMAQALRDKAAAEKASFDTRVQSGEWGPAPDAGTEADCQLEHVAQVEGDAVVRTLRWNKNVGAFEYPVGTKLYAASAPLASAPAAPPVEQQAARATVYIQRDHLEKAQRAPFLCRVEPTQRLPDFVPMHPTEQPSQDAEGAARYRWLRDIADPDEGHPYSVTCRTDSWGNWRFPHVGGAELDAAIDAARAAQAQAQGEKGKA